MTLILTLVTSRNVVQVSDRVVTASTRTVDKLANKVLVYRARDALVSIGYTGLAFLGGVPTDQWIAERLWGESVVGAGGKPAAIAFRKTPSGMDVGLALMRLRDELERVSKILPKPEPAHPLQINVAG